MLNRAKDFTEFREACSYAVSPSFHTVFADVNGTIGYQVLLVTWLEACFGVQPKLVKEPGDIAVEDCMMTVLYVPRSSLCGADDRPRARAWR